MRKLIPGVDFFVYYLPYKLPPHFGGFCTPNDDHTFSVYIDPSKPQEVQEKTYAHEVSHLENGDFDIGVDPVEAEKRCG